MPEYPPVSIVVAVYNMQDTIGRCIQSLLEVDYPEKEIIVVNDGSTDGIEEIVKQYPISESDWNNLLEQTLASLALLTSFQERHWL